MRHVVTTSVVPKQEANYETTQLSNYATISNHFGNCSNNNFITSFVRA